MDSPGANEERCGGIEKESTMRKSRVIDYWQVRTRAKSMTALEVSLVDTSDYTSVDPV